MRNAHGVTKDFEAALCEYTGAPFAVAVTSCTMALLLAVAWWKNVGVGRRNIGAWIHNDRLRVEIPKRTYVGVPMSIVHAGGRPTFRDETWLGSYRLSPLPVYDSARYFEAGMFCSPRPNVGTWSGDDSKMVCVSFHWSKVLGIQQGGAILHDDPDADEWLRMARFDGRKEGVAPKEQKDWILGWHCYMSPEVSAEGLMRLGLLAKRNDPLPNDDYPDLSSLEIFR